jgi:hypothetical protein
MVYTKAFFTCGLSCSGTTQVQSAAILGADCHEAHKRSTQRYVHFFYSKILTWIETQLGKLRVESHLRPCVKHGFHCQFAPLSPLLSKFF